jgi:sugar phosphate isomerase/epimerase
MSRLPLSRRQAIRLGLASTASLGMGWRFTLASDDSPGKPKPGKIGDFKISLAEWSLHRRLFADRGQTTQLNLDFPRMAREEFGIDAVEYVNQFFKDKAHDTAYLSELKKRADDQGVTNVLIMIDGEGDLSAPSRDERTKAVENHKKWVDAAAALGCHAIRINTGDHYSPDHTQEAAEACRALTEYGAQHQIAVICENHGGPSSWPDALIALIKAVDHPNFGTLPDFGNFPPRSPAAKGGPKVVDPYEAVARMMPYAKGVSAKSYAFGPDGKETTLDYARLLKIVTDAGYHGYVGVEYEGQAPEPEGILATRKLLESLRGAEYPG